MYLVYVAHPSTYIQNQIFSKFRPKIERHHVGRRGLFVKQRSRDWNTVIGIISFQASSKSERKKKKGLFSFMKRKDKSTSS